MNLTASSFSLGKGFQQRRATGKQHGTGTQGHQSLLLALPAKNQAWLNRVTQIYRVHISLVTIPEFIHSPKIH